MPLYEVNDKVYVMMDGDPVHWTDPPAERSFPYLRGICPLLGKIKHIGGEVDGKVAYYVEFLNGRVYGWFDEEKISPDLFELAAKCGVDATIM